MSRKKGDVKAGRMEIYVYALEKVIKLSPSITWKISNVFYSLVKMLENRILVLAILEKELHEAISPK